MPSSSFVAEDRGDDDVAAVRDAREQPADAVEVVGAVPDLERTSPRRSSRPAT
jgi:hypothetical protein